MFDLTVPHLPYVVSADGMEKSRLPREYGGPVLVSLAFCAALGGFGGDVFP